MISKDQEVLHSFGPRTRSPARKPLKGNVIAKSASERVRVVEGAGLENDSGDVPATESFSM